MGACADGNEIDMSNTKVYFQDHPLPVGQGYLRILALGNSFTNDAFWLVGDILEDLGVDPNTYSIYIASHTAATLEYWCNVYKSDEMVDLCFCGGKRMDVEHGSLRQLLEQPWDVVVLTQYSGQAMDYGTFNPWIRYLIDLIQQHCPNPNVTLAWQMAWSHGKTHSASYFNWMLISSAVQHMVWNDGINVVIPVGTAIQNARSTQLNSESQLTCDGWHLNEGVGRYIAACTVVQSLFAPVYDISVWNDHSCLNIPLVTEQLYPPEPVTDENRLLCQQCAIKAVEQPFSVMQ